MCGNPACRKKCPGVGNNFHGGPPEFDGDVCPECNNLVSAARLAGMGLHVADIDDAFIAKIDALHAGFESSSEEEVTLLLFAFF